ncbi:MAG: fumarylacetoacetate hydrolase family protein [Planctomycetota bacterium]
MQLASVIVDGQPALAAQTERGVVPLEVREAFPHQTLKSVLRAGATGWAAAEAASQRGRPLPLTQVQFRPLIPDASKLICVGRNYAEHAREQGAEVPQEPLIFAKAPSALHPHQGEIQLPKPSDQVDYEAELVVVIGRRAWQVPQAEALDYVAGYCCGNDVTARDWQKQKPGQQWLLGKSFDTFAPLGPWLVSSREVVDPGSLQVQMQLNGRVVQNGHTSQMMFPVDFLIAYLTQVMTLEVGDLIFTGTPAGVGVAQDPPRFLQPGDHLAVEIDGVGRLENRVVAAR